MSEETRPVPHTEWEKIKEFTNRAMRNGLKSMYLNPEGLDKDKSTA